MMTADETYLTVDEEAGAAYLYLRGMHDVDHTEEITSDVLVDLNDEGKVIGVELLSLTAEVPFDVLRGEYGVASEDLEALEDLTDR